MLVCVDTNVMLRVFARNSPIAPIFLALADGRLQLAVSTPILLEYREIIVRKGGPHFWAKLERWLDLADALHGNIRSISPSFHFHVVTADADDNIFTDCAIVADADYLITEDRHFEPLANAGYKPQPITPQEFIARFLDARS